MIGIRVFVILLVSTVFGILNTVYTQKTPDECLDCGCCVNSTCNAKNDACTYGCVDGYHGHRCYSMCPKYCKRCARYYGTAHRPADYQICYECADGYFNGTFITNCSSPCPRNCLDGVCDKNNGICSLGCTGNFKSRTCTQCKDGWYQNDCSRKCPDNCKSDKCYKNTGYCTDGCKIGYRGNVCAHTCPEGCLDNTCWWAKCKNGCKPGYSGDFCCIKSDNCVTCASVSKCLVCKFGYWGQLCDKECNLDCFDNSCNMFNGSCKACEDGFYGDLCNATCSDTCLDSVCHPSDGSCNNCTDGYFGSFCENTCSVRCSNTSCSQHGGECLYGCVQGYNGTFCDINSKPTPDFEEGETGFVKGFVIGASVGVVVTVASTVVLWIVCWKRRTCLPSERKDTSDVYENTRIESSNTNVQDDSQTTTDFTADSEFPDNYENTCTRAEPANPSRVSNQYESLDTNKMEKESNYAVPNVGTDA